MSEQVEFETEQPDAGYWSVIPYPVLQSQTLSDKDKLVYGVIASLTRAKNKQGAILGYCFASNAYLAEVMGCGERTITRAIADLVDAGELIVQHVGVPDKKGNRQRRIYTLETYARSIAKIGSTASFGDTGIDKSGETVNRYDNKRKDKPPITPHEISKRFDDYANGDLDLLAALEGFAEKRAASKNPINTERMATLLLGKLDKLSGGNAAIKIAMLNKAVEHNWASVYALKEQDLAELAPPDRSRVAPRREEDECLN